MRRKTIQKDIQNVDYKTKYLGRGRLIKKNKVLISVLTTSAFLLPVTALAAVTEKPVNPLTSFSQMDTRSDWVFTGKEEYKRTQLANYFNSTSLTIDSVEGFEVGSTLISFNIKNTYPENWTPNKLYSIAVIIDGKKIMYNNYLSFYDVIMTGPMRYSIKVTPESDLGKMLKDKDSFNPDTKISFIMEYRSSDDVTTNNGRRVQSYELKPTIVDPYISFEINRVKDRINNSQWLSSQEKEQLIKELDAEKVDSRAQVDKVVKDYNQKIDKLEAKAELNKKAQTINEKIESSLEMTDAEKAQAKSDIDGILQAGLSAIDNASTTSEISEQVDNHKAQMDEEFKKYALANLEKVVAETKKAIEDDPTLSAKEKEAQLKAADEAGKLGRDAISNATGEEAIQKALSDEIKNIKNEHKPGTPMADQKANAKGDLEKVIADTKEAIKNDPTLSADEKKAQTEAVDTAGDLAKKSIDDAVTSDAISNAVTQGTQNIEDEYKPGKPLDEQKALAKESLEKVIADTKEAIKNDPTLSADEKKAQTEAVDKAGETAKKAVDTATTPDGVNNAVTTGSEAIKKEHQPGTPIADQKTKAKEDLEKVIADTKEAIKNDPTLSADEKKAQTEAVDKTGEVAIKALDDANTSDEISSAVSKGTKEIKDEHKPGTPVADQKTKALADIEKVITDTKTAIENDPTLTTAEKEKQKAAVDEAGKVAKEAIGNATTAEALNQAVETGTTAIIKEHVPGDGLDVRKEAAKNLIDKEVANTKKAIENDPTLTASEKEKQIQSAIDEGENAKKNIDAATDANGVDAATAKGIETVANQHKSGDAVAVRKEDAKKAIDEEAKIIKEKIANDPTLTNEEKQEQSTKVDQEATKAKENIDTATTADGVDEAKGKGIELIDKQYQPGSSLDARKEEAKKAIDEEAKAIKEKIANDPTLTKEEKELQSGKVDQEATKAKENIDAAKDASGVDGAKGKGIEAIDNQHQPGSSLDGRKESAKNAIDKEAALTKEQIANDPTLTDTQKAEQSEKVDAEATKAKGNIDTATNADGIDEAKGKGVELIDNQYQPGEPLVSRKESAKEAIDQEVQKISDRINNDPTLTNEEKADQIKGVAAEATKAKENIDAATDATGVDSAKGTGIELIDNQYKPGDSLNSRKESAKDAIDREAALITDRISNDVTLTPEEKVAQISGVTEEAAKAKGNIDAAEDASGVDSAKGKGIELIDNQYQPGVSIVERKESAKEAIDQEAALTKERINNDPTLTDEEKVDQSAKVDQEAVNAKTAIDGATDAAGVDTSKGQGITNIDNQYETKQPLEERKEAAKKGIDEAANAAKERIANDPTLTNEEKQKQSAGVDADAVNAKNAIDAAPDASSVDREKGQGVTNIDSNYQPGTALDSRKELAKEGIDQAATEAKDKIANDPTLTEEEKAKQISGVDESAAKAKDAIEKAEDASGVDREKGQGITNIDNNYQPVTGLNIRKDLAKNDIDEAAKATKEKINNDPTLTTEEKAKQSAGVDEAATKAKDAIDVAKTADDVDSAKGQGITNIDNNYKPGDPLNGRKEAAKSGIDEAAKATKEKIANDPTLTDKEKTEQSAGVDKAAEVAKKAIEEAEDASGVDKAKGQGITNIDKEYKTGNILDARKEEAKKAIDQEAKLIKEKINNDPTLTKEEKAKQSAGVDTAAEAAKEAIDAAKNADGVDSAKGQGITNIDNNYQPGSALDNRKEEAKKAIDEEAKVVKEKINNDSTLTKAEKEKQSKLVDEEVKKAKEAIDAAKTADDVDAAKGQGITTIDKQYQTGNVLDTRKEEAKKAIDDAAKATKEAIAKDTTLTTKEKEAQTKAVDAETKKAKEAINAAKTADDVDAAKGQGISDINKQHQSNELFVKEKEEAKKELEETAEKVKEKIKNDSNLTAKEKKAQIKAVDEALAKAKEAIAVADADSLAKVKAEAVASIESQYKPGQKTPGGNGGTSTGGKGTSSGGGYTSGTSGKTGYSVLPKTGSESTGYLAGLIGFALSGLALLGFRKRRETEEE